MRSDWWVIPTSILCALAVIWLILAATLWLVKPDAAGIQRTMRLLPDLVRLLKRLAVDPEMPWRIRIALLLVVAVLVLPIDLIPDAIPVIGFADDVIIIGLMLRWVARTAGRDALARHWPGTPDGFTVLCRLCGLPSPAVD